MEKKKYYVVDLMHTEGIDETPKCLYVVDCVHKKILSYNMNNDCKDVTARTKRIYETDKGKLWSERRIGCDLVELMDGRFTGRTSEILLATDNAREVTRKVASVRAIWFDIRTKRLERAAASESAGWGETASDDYIAECFTDL